MTAHLGSDIMDPEEANRIYSEGRYLLKRYSPNSSHSLLELDGELDKNTFTVRDGSGRIIGVVRGNVFDRDAVINDMVRASALTGELGELVADLNSNFAKAKKLAEREEGLLYNKYTTMVHQNAVSELVDVPKTKITSSNITALAQNDEAYVKTLESLALMQRNRERAINLQASLTDLQNALKKALEYGDKAQ